MTVRTALALAFFTVLSLPAEAQLPLQIRARDDRPAPVRVQVDAWNGGGTNVFQAVVEWSADDNGYSTQPLVPLSVPTNAAVLRLTFINDSSGGSPDTDRNAFIDSYRLDGNLREAENWDRTGGTDVAFPGCGSTTVDGVGVADWERDRVPVPEPRRFGLGL